MSSKFALYPLIICTGSFVLAQTPMQQPALLPNPSPVLTQGMPGVPGMGLMSVAPNPLKYRDSSKPLTIGEMSDMAAQKSQSDFMQRQGYSTEEPPKAVAPPKERPSLRVQALAQWGGSTNQAEILLNGRLMRVRGGETLGHGVSVESVNSSGVTLAIDMGKKDKNRRGGAAKREVTLKTIKSGQSTEIML